MPLNPKEITREFLKIALVKNKMDPGDNGIYVIEGWHIADHLRTEHDSDWNPVGMRSFGPSEEED